MLAGRSKATAEPPTAPAEEAEHDPSRTGGTSPLSPAESLASIRVKPGFRVELVAAEPLVVDPVAIDFGADGRLWVAEMRDYPSGIDGNFKPGGRVKVLDDPDGDGRYDRATVFLEDVPFPTGVTVWRDGVLVCAAPDILFARDTDGDGRADDIKKLYSGFSTHNYQARVNSLQPGLDHWMYASTGLFGGQIESFSGNAIDLTSRDFRFKPESGEIEAVTGQTQQSRVRDDWDNWFGCDNSTLIRHYPVVDRYVRRNPQVAPPDVAVSVADYPESNRLYPIAERLVTFQLSGPPGFVTSACGLAIYRDVLLGDEYYGNSFTCDPVNQLVHRLILSPRGVTFSGHRARDEQQSEFLASTDNWFRPVQARTGPDGALWIVDIYRYLIEHPIWIPSEALATIDVRAGDTRGRIYRVYPEEVRPRPIVRLDRLDARELAAALDSPNGTQRDLAQQRLVAQGPEWARDAVPALERLARKATRPQVRVQALAALDGAATISPEMLIAALDDPHPGVRRQAIRLAERLANPADALVAKLIGRAVDGDPQVRMQLAYSLGELRGDQAAAALVKLTAASASDAQLEAAALSSIHRDNAPNILQRLLDEKTTAPPARLLEVLLGLPEIAADEKLRASVAALAAAGVERDPQTWRFQVAARLLDRRVAGEGRPDAEAERAIARIVANARELIAAGQGNLDTQVTAVRTLGYRAAEEADKDVALLTGLLGPKAPLEVQLAGIDQLSRLAVDAAPAAWLERWDSHTPVVRTAILDALASRPAWSFRLLEAIESGKVRRAELDAARRQRLLTASDPSIRALAERALADVASSDRGPVIAGYSAVASMRGDSVRGRQVFAKTCATCHRLEDAGHAVGPDLAPLAHKPPQSLLLAILDPNQAVDPRYANYLAVTTDGRQFTGLLTSETAASLTLVAPDNKQQTLLRTDVEQLASTGKSLMPEGFEKEIDIAAMADLLAYLESAAAPRKIFAGNQPEIVRANEQGAYQLTAAQCEIRGPQLLFESQFGNLGFWGDETDSATWTIDVAHAGEYEVALDYACHDEAAGNRYVLETPAGTVKGQVAGTGQWSDYRQVKIGRLTLAQGTQKWSMRSEGPIAAALIDLKAIRLERVSE